MPDWSQQQQHKPPDQSIQLDSDEEEEEDAAPPKEYFLTCRDLFPSSTRRDALRAWDRTKGIGAGGCGRSGKEGGMWDPNGARVQAALGVLVDLCNVDDPVAAASSSISGPTQHKRPRSPLPLPLDDGDDPLRPMLSSARVIDLSSSPPPAKRARPSLDGPAGTTSAHKFKGKGKGKAVSREVDLVLGDSDDEIDVDVDVELDQSVEILSPMRKKKKLDKGKGRAVSPPPLPPAANAGSEVDLIDLAASSDIELDYQYGAASTSASTSAKRARRTPSLILPSLPTPPPSPLTQILSIIPDVLPSHATTLLESEEGAGDPQKVIDLLLEAKEYPKLGADEGDKKENAEPAKDWMDVPKREREREDPSPLYKRIALDNLYASFPLLPAPLIKSTFLSPPYGPAFFAPTYLALHTADEKGDYDARKLKKARKAPKKVVRVVRRVRVDPETGEEREEEVEEEEMPPVELQREMDWVRAKILKERHEARLAAHEAAAAKAEEERVERLNARARKKGQAVECQCCFDEVAPVNTASCDNSHLFCKSCCAANASDRLGRRLATLPCMAPDCTAFFSPRSWPDFLPQKTIDGLEKLAQESEVGKAFEGVEGFETCPFCPYACYIENPNERLFRCERADCRKISCRKCRKESHIPFTCEEADADRRLPGVHAVAESMTAAFIRKCPKCKVATAKIDGCNHITCQCGAHWCYICRAPIKGYNHFSNAPGGCPNFDDTAMRNYNEIEEARRAAEAQLDDLTRADAAKLAAEAPHRPPPRFPVAPVAVQAGQAAVNGFQAFHDRLAAINQRLQQQLQGLNWGLGAPVPPQPHPQGHPGQHGWP